MHFSLLGNFVLLIILIHHSQIDKLTYQKFLMVFWVSSYNFSKINVNCKDCDVRVVMYVISFILFNADTSHLGVLMVALKKVVYRWKDLGDQLSVDYYKQNEIEEDNRGIGRKCIREMLAAWLKGGEYNKQALKTALQNMDYQIIFESHA